MEKIKRGDRYTNHLGKICTVKSIQKGVIKLQVIDDKPYTEVWDLGDFKSNLKFIKIPMPKIDRTNISKYLLEYQLNLIGKTLKESKETPGWFDMWSISREDVKLFRSYAIPLLKKTFKFNTKKANETFDWFFLQFGLKIK